jgi:hypothetical protein
MGIGDVKPMRFDIVEALVHIHTGRWGAAGHLQCLERRPGPEAWRQIGTGTIAGETEDAAGLPLKL